MYELIQMALAEARGIQLVNGGDRFLAVCNPNLLARIEELADDAVINEADIYIRFCGSRSILETGMEDGFKSDIAIVPGTVVFKGDKYKIVAEEWILACFREIRI